MKLNLFGPGPFHLPHPKEVTVEKVSAEVVSLHLHVEDASGDPPKVVSADMTIIEARNIAIKLWLAADA